MSKFKDDTPAPISFLDSCKPTTDYHPVSQQNSMKLIRRPQADEKLTRIGGPAVIGCEDERHAEI